MHDPERVADGKATSCSSVRLCVAVLPSTQAISRGHALFFGIEGCILSQEFFGATMPAGYFMAR
jgi:hypothetical protein